jgi:hypothetical protein
MNIVLNPSREQIRVEREFAAGVVEWLARRELPADAVIWYPDWDVEERIEVRDMHTLADLVSALQTGHAGLKRNGSTGPWAQIKAYTGGGTRFGGWPYELHPHDWSRGAPEGVWGLISNDADDLAADAWSWLTRGEPPAGFPKPNKHPGPGASFW